MAPLPIDAALRIRRSRRNKARSAAPYRRASELRTKGFTDRAVDLLRPLLRLDNVRMTMTYLSLLNELQDLAAVQHTLRALLAFHAASPEALAAHAERLLGLCEQSGLGANELAPLVSSEDGCATARLAFRYAHGEWLSQFTPVSLGLQCHGWALLNRWGFRTADQAISGYGPFSLSVHRLEGVLAALESDFEDYFVPEKIRVVPTAQDRRMAVRPELGTAWNHHIADYWLRNDMAQLKKALASQAECFRQSSRAERPVFVMLEAANPDEIDSSLPRLVAALQRYTPAAPRLIFANFQNCAEDSLGIIGDRVALLACPYPEKGYRWADPRKYNSEEGHAWEQRFADLLIEALRRVGNAA